MKPLPKPPRRSARSSIIRCVVPVPSIALTLALMLILGLGGCASDRGARTAHDDDDAAASGPTVYGQVGASVDSVTVHDIRVH